MDIVNLVDPELTIQRLSIQPHDSWCFFGTNNSGIERFLQLLTGHSKREKSHQPPALLPHAGLVSFESLQDIFEEEMKKDNSDFLDYIDPGTEAQQFIPPSALEHPLIDKLGMRQVLNKGYRQLSSGQTRKLLLLKEILSGNVQLLIQCPYDGLDAISRRELDLALQIISNHILLILLVHNKDDIPSWCSHYGVFQDNNLKVSGPRQTVLNAWPENIETAIDIELKRDHSHVKETLVELKNGFAGYGSTILFTGLDLTIQTGDHTLVTGPNGCGKSTLLHIITGDQSKCYANDLRIFGKKRGNGESIWQLKKEMGIVSPELHRNHRIPGTALDVVVSGLYDSIGLYTTPTRSNKKDAHKWLSWLELSNKAAVPFRKLSFAEQRLVLIARGLIKIPKLLILDEPTQGLDEQYRQRLLALMEKIVTDNVSTILFVSHREDEHRPFFKQRIALDQYAPDGNIL